ncbi:MAG: homoserine dehydrogenase [Propionibacteriaceae bacterium]|jgi:homoserine dehydrogenase|nr:homoserine dehydrogenase [Propionibacteriaceae bacterium]
MMESTAQPPKLRIALLGFGIVGSRVGQMLIDEADLLAKYIGREIEFIGIAERDESKDHQGVPDHLFVTDAAKLIIEGEPDVVVELIGGLGAADELIKLAIAQGASVVTANKALLAARGQEFFGLAQAAGVDLYFEAAVAGAIPIIRALSESLVAYGIYSITGIVNGTTNFILDKMSSDGATYADALVKAQELGFAELDPTADIEGIDAANKTALLASLAFGTWVGVSDVFREGISALVPGDFRAAAANGCVIKLLAKADLHDDGSVSVRVHPAMVPIGHPLASVSGANNSIAVSTHGAGELMFYGLGAGGTPTASAVIGDVVTVGRNRVGGVVGMSVAMSKTSQVLPMSANESQYFLRFDVADVPGILSQVGAVLASHHVSVRNLSQASNMAEEPSRAAELGVLTHVTNEGDLLACVAELDAAAFVRSEVRVMRVEG